MLGRTFYLFLRCVCVWERDCTCVFVPSLFFVCEFLGTFCVWLRLTHVSSCVSCVGLLVQDLTDTILSSYAYKSHYLLTESNRAELKLPMIPSPSSATKKNVGKGNCTVFLFCPTGLCLCCACSASDVFCLLVHIFHFKALQWNMNWLFGCAVNFNVECCKVISANFLDMDNVEPHGRTVKYSFLWVLCGIWFTKLHLFQIIPSWLNHRCK